MQRWTIGGERSGWFDVLWTAMLLALASSGCGGVREQPRRASSSGDAIMLADNTHLSHGLAGWAAGPTGVTANIIQADEAVGAAFDALPSGTLVFQNVAAWNSNQGPTSFDLSSSLQHAFAQWDGSRYPINGLAAGPAFADTDTLTVLGAGATETSVTVDVPPPLADATQLLDGQNAFATQVRIPDGTFDQLYVFAVADDGSAGDDGLMRFVNAADMTLDGGMRTAPLLDADAIAELDKRSMTVTTIYVAYLDVKETSAFFDGRAVPVQAGRMFQIAASDLWP